MLAASDLIERDRLFPHQNGDALDNGIKEVATRVYQTTIQRALGQPPSAISQLAAVNHAVHVRKKRFAGRREGGAILRTAQHGDYFTRQHDRVLFLSSSTAEERAAYRITSVANFARNFKGQLCSAMSRTRWVR
jgi:hypothetical protein